MTDAELIARLRGWANGIGSFKFKSHQGDWVRQHDGWVTLEAHTHLTAADRIEALTKERDQHWDSFVHWHKQADDLTGQLAAARQDAKEAEAYAEELEEELRDTQDRANAFATKEYYTEMRAERAEAKLAKAVEALSDLMMHEPDHPDTIWEKARATVAEIKGESHD